MRYFYLCNTKTTQISTFLGMEEIVFGGWLEKVVENMLMKNEIVFISPNIKNVETKISDNLYYVGFEKKNNNVDFFEKLLSKYSPDIIHIWGSEFEHSYNMVEAAKNKKLNNKCILSIQGLTSEYSKVYDAFLPKKIVNRWILGDILRGNNIKKLKNQFFKRAVFEVKTLNSIKHVIGRTEWDRKSVLKINDKLKYHFCGESLRDIFYQGYKWEENKCDKYSIFVCQSSYPVKGFHFAILILVEVLKKYPNAKLITTGKPFTTNSLVGKLKQSSYQNYIRKLIEKYNLEDHIISKGKLSAVSIKDEILSSNVLLSPSVIENSPNSIGEALMLGAPIVSSNVGGVESIMSTKEGYFYEVNDIEEASRHICSIFENVDKEMLTNARNRAKEQYSVELIKKRLESIYDLIIDKN